MKTVTFKGKEYKIAFNLATEIEYFRLTGRYLEPSEISQDGKLNPLTLGNIARAVIKTNNNGADPDEVLMSEDRGSIDVCIECYKAFLEWSRIPEHAEDHVERPKQEEGDESPKE